MSDRLEEKARVLHTALLLAEDAEWQRLIATALREVVREAAKVATSYGDMSAGGAGSQVIQNGPSKGQRYGEGYYNLADSILRHFGLREEGK